MLNNLGLFLSKRAHLSPEVEAYVESDGSYRLTYKELNDRCSQLANAFVAAGIEKGERVGLLLMNSSEFMESYYALAKIGAVVVPLNWRLVADELEFILKDSGTKRLIFDSRCCTWYGVCNCPSVAKRAHTTSLLDVPVDDRRSYRLHW